MKRKDCSSEEADPGLSKGFAYVVEETGFQEHLKRHDNDTEPKSTCSRHDAVNLADTRPGMGFATTGVATVECARHNMKRPSGVGDLQRGERLVYPLLTQNNRINQNKTPDNLGKTEKIKGTI